MNDECVKPAPDDWPFWADGCPYDPAAPPTDPTPEADYFWEPEPDDIGNFGRPAPAR